MEKNTMKKRVMITIDNDVHIQAQVKGLNISEVCQKSIETLIGLNIANPESMKSCFKCGIKQNLIWLCPDEKWCCENCIDRKIKKVIAGVPPA